MSIREVSRIAWDAILKNKIRSLLTMLGIIIGVSAVIMVISISAGTEATISDQIQGLGSDLVFITPSFTRGGAQSIASQSGTGVVFSDAAAIDQQVPGVLGVTVEQGSAENVSGNGVKLTNIDILGTTADFPEVRGMKIESGSFYDQQAIDLKEKVAVLGSGLA
jgi:putative ABC transport system permease protein